MAWGARRWQLQQVQSSASNESSAELELGSKFVEHSLKKAAFRCNVGSVASQRASSQMLHNEHFVAQRGQ